MIFDFSQAYTQSLRAVRGLTLEIGGRRARLSRRDARWLVVALEMKTRIGSMSSPPRRE